MNNRAFLTPPDVLLSDALKLSMARENLSLRDILLVFNDPEEERPLWKPSGPLAALERDKLHLRERTIHGRRVAVLCRWKQAASAWELAHSTVSSFVQ